MASNVVQMVLQIKDGATAALESVSDAADDAAESADGAAKQFKISGEAMAKFGAAALTAGAAVFSLIQSVVDARGELSSAAIQTGLTAKTIGGLKLAARGAGLELDALVGGLVDMPKRMDEARRETGEALVAFERLAISVTKADGSLRSVDAVLAESIEKLNGVEDQTEKAALATILFGGAGANLMQALSGSELEEFVNQAHRFGVTVGPDAAKAAGDFQRELANMELMADGAKERLIAAFGDGPGSAGKVMKAFGSTLIGVSTAYEVHFESLRKVLGAFTGHLGQVYGELINLSRVMDLIADKKFHQAFDVAAGAMERIVDSALASGDQSREGVRDLLSFKSIRKGFEEGMAAFDAATAGTGGGDDKDEKKKKQTKLVDSKEGGSSAKKADDQLKQLQQMLVTLNAMEQGLERQTEELRQLPHDVALAMLDSVTGPLLKPTETLRNSLSKSLGPGGTLIGAFADIGAQNPKQIAKEFAGFFKNIVRAFTTVLPELIVMIPQVLIESLPQVLGGLLKALPKLIGSVVFKLPAMLIKVFGRWLVKSIGGFFDVFINDLPSKFVKGLRRWFKGALRKIRDIFKPGKIFRPETKAGRRRLAVATFGVSEVFRGVRKIAGKKHSGGFIGMDGLFNLQKGERVIPNSGIGPQTIEAAGNIGGGQVINIHTNVVDPNSIRQLGLLLNREFGSKGRSRGVSIFNSLDRLAGAM